MCTFHIKQSIFNTLPIALTNSFRFKCKRLTPFMVCTWYGEVFASSDAVDSNFNTMSHTAESPPDYEPWFMVDLENWLYVYSISMATRRDCCGVYLLYSSFCFILSCHFYFENEKKWVVTAVFTDVTRHHQ